MRIVTVGIDLAKNVFSKMVVKWGQTTISHFFRLTAPKGGKNNCGPSPVFDDERHGASRDKQQPPAHLDLRDLVLLRHAVGTPRAPDLRRDDVNLAPIAPRVARHGTVGHRHVRPRADASQPRRRDRPGIDRAGNNAGQISEDDRRPKELWTGRRKTRIHRRNNDRHRSPRDAKCGTLNPKAAELIITFARASGNETVRAWAVLLRLTETKRKPWSVPGFREKQLWSVPGFCTVFARGGDLQAQLAGGPVDRWVSRHFGSWREHESLNAAWKQADFQKQPPPMCRS